MAYVKQEWVGSTNPLVGDPGSTPVTDVSLNHLETQYDEALAQVATDVADPESAIGTQLSATVVATPGVKASIVGGAIRNQGGPDYWQVLDVDTNHQPYWIDSVVTDATKITVNYADLGAAVTGVMIAALDETLAQAGFFVGTSVDQDKTEIRIGRYVKPFMDYISYNGTEWVSQNGVSTFSWAAGVLTITHPEIPIGTEHVVTLAPRGGSYVPSVSSAGSPVSRTAVKVEFRGWDGALATEPDTNMRMFIGHGAGGVAAIDPRTVTTTAFPLSNIWLFGAMS